MWGEEMTERLKAQQPEGFESMISLSWGCALVLCNNRDANNG